MNVRSEILKAQGAIFLAGALAFATIPTSTALAAEPAAPVTKASPQVAGWEFHGEIEAGGQFFIDRPPTGFGRLSTSPYWLTPPTTESRAKYEEFGSIKPGLLLDYVNLGFATKDGLYDAEFWGTNIGRNNQNYRLDMSKVGQHYLSLEWDQIPHLISTSAKSVFGGVGSADLSVNDALQTSLQTSTSGGVNNLRCADATTVSAAPCAGGQGALARAALEGFINGDAKRLELSTQRDKASVDYRYTPNDNWEFKVDYSHEHRTGVRPLAMNYGYSYSTAAGAVFPGFPSNVVEVPQPIDDTTQIVNAGFQYTGTTPWNKKWTASLKYTGSFYDNDLKHLDVENPFCITCDFFTGGAGAPHRGPNMLRMALPPSSHANAFTFNSAVDMPWALKSRWMNTVQYNMMRQNDPFINTMTNGFTFGAGANSVTPYPANSLNGKVDTLLANQVLTTQITKDLKSVLRYRYYDIDNNTPELVWDEYLRADSSITSGDSNRRINLSMSYTKQNASSELNWRAQPWLTFGALYGWEKYDRTRRDIDVTNEYMGKIYANATPADWIQARASYLYSQRRYDHYDTEHFVEIPAAAVLGQEIGSHVVPNMRRYNVANRNRSKAEALVDFNVSNNVTITPNAGLRWEDFPEDVYNQLGVRKDHSWNAGVDVGVRVNPALRLTFAYNYEDRKFNMKNGNGIGSPSAGNQAIILADPQGVTILEQCTALAAFNPSGMIGPLCTWQSDIRQRYNTFIVAADWKAIPNKLDFRFDFTAALSLESNNTTPCSAPLLVGGATGVAVGTSCNGSAQTIGSATAGTLQVVTDPAFNNGQFPKEKNNFMRFNAIAKYSVDPDTVRRMGLNGQVILKARYAWERNRNTNWATDNMTPYIPTEDTNELTGGSRSVFMAYNNPNYTAQLFAVSAAVKW